LLQLGSLTLKTQLQSPCSPGSGLWRPSRSVILYCTYLLLLSRGREYLVWREWGSLTQTLSTAVWQPLSFAVPPCTHRTACIDLSALKLPGPSGNL
jgi:hypothetical protein